MFTWELNKFREIFGENSLIWRNISIIMANFAKKVYTNASMWALVALLITFPFVASWSQTNSTQYSLREKAEEISTLTNSIRSY